MNLLSYNYFIYITYTLASLNIALPWLLDSSASVPAKLSLSIVGLIILIAALVSADKDLPKLNFISKKMVLLIVFILSIIQTFLPYLLSFTDKSNLVWLALAIPAANLVTIFFTKFEDKES
jgi:hypothetical protein